MSAVTERTTGSKNTLTFIPDWAEFGTASVDDLLRGAPSVDVPTSEGVEFAGARFVQVIYEIDMYASRALLPPALAPVRGPAFVMFRGYQLPETPWGPTSIAQVGTLCRFGYRPRVFQLAVKTDNPRAVAPLRSGWGMPVSTAENVELRRYHDGTHLTVTDGGETILALQTAEPILTSGGSLGINSSVNLVNTPKGARILQVAEDFTFAASEVGTPDVRTFVDAGWGLSGMTARYPVSAVTAVADITLRPVQFVSDAIEPALLNIRSAEEI